MKALLQLPARSFSLAAGALILLLVTGAALLAPLLAANDPMDIAGMSFLWPGSESGLPLGTDMLGRDLLSGILYGARVSLQIGLLAGLLATAAGLVVGAVSGYFGGWVGSLLMRFAELFQVTPSLLLTIAIVAVLGPSATNIVLGIAITGWPQIARLVRAEALRLRRSDFIQTAVIMGFGRLRILARHVIPNVVAPAIAMVSILSGTAILTESSLSFLGLGDPNIVTWGTMIGAGREVLRTDWYMTAIPGFAILVTVLGFSLLGNGLNDLLNPRRSAHV